jgi:AmiR/NasT family two-component response regulator
MFALTFWSHVGSTMNRKKKHKRCWNVEAAFSSGTDVVFMFTKLVSKSRISARVFVQKRENSPLLFFSVVT